MSENIKATFVSRIMHPHENRIPFPIENFDTLRSYGITLKYKNSETISLEAPLASGRPKIEVSRYVEEMGKTYDWVIIHWDYGQDIWITPAVPEQREWSKTQTSMPLVGVECSEFCGPESTGEKIKYNVSYESIMSLKFRLSFMEEKSEIPFYGTVSEVLLFARLKSCKSLVMKNPTITLDLTDVLKSFQCSTPFG